MPQLPFPLHLPTHLEREDYFVSESNQEAYEWIRRWPEWNSHGLILYGEPSSGKTHLSHIWQEQSDAVRINATQLPLPDVHALNKVCVVVDNIDLAQLDHTWLFHLLNIISGQKAYILLIMPQPPAQFTGKLLPDLASRLKALPSVGITAPDDALLSAIMLKYFSDRQLRLAEDVIPYLLPRIERSFSAVRGVVDAIDAISLQEKRSITVPLARSVIEKSHQL